VLEDVHDKDVCALESVIVYGRPALASASMDQTIRLWDTTTWDCLGVLDGHTDSVLATTTLRGGTVLASGSDDCSIRVWELCQDEKLPGKCTDADTETAEGKSAYVSNDAGDDVINKTDATPTEAGMNGACTSSRLLTSHEDYVSCLTVCRTLMSGVDASLGDDANTDKDVDSDQVMSMYEALVSAGGDFCVKIWDSRTWVCTRTLERDSLTSHLASSGNMLLITAMSDESNYERCFLSMWIMTSRTGVGDSDESSDKHPQWKRNARSLEIPPPQCLLLGKLESQDVIVARNHAERVPIIATPAGVETESSSVGDVGRVAPGGFSNPEQLLIATGEGEGAADDETCFPVYIWRGGPVRSPVRTPMQPLAPPSAKSARMDTNDKPDVERSEENTSNDVSTLENNTGTLSAVPAPASQTTMAKDVPLSTLGSSTAPSSTSTTTSSNGDRPQQGGGIRPTGGVSSQGELSASADHSQATSTSVEEGVAGPARGSPSKKRLTGPRAAGKASSLVHETTDDDMSTDSRVADTSAASVSGARTGTRGGGGRGERRRRGRMGDETQSAGGRGVDTGDATGLLEGDELVKSVVASLARVPGLSTSMESLLHACLNLPPAHPRR
jgi:hypothetical protein